MNSVDVYSQMAERIIKQQETIIGPVAIEQAGHVPNLKLDWDKHEVSISGAGDHVIDALVRQYKELFGKTSVEVCKEAVGSLMKQLPEDQLPKSLA